MLDSTALTVPTQKRGVLFHGMQHGRMRETDLENEEWFYLPRDTKNSHGRQAWPQIQSTDLDNLPLVLCKRTPNTPERIADGSSYPFLPACSSPF